LRDAMRVPARQPETAIDVVLLGPAEALPSPPPAPQPPPLHATVRAAPGPRTRARPIVAQPSATAAPDSSTQAPALKVFNPDGTVWQPARPLAPASTPFELARELMYRGHNIVHCRRTMFADGYRFDESVGDRIARRYLSWIGLYGEAAAERLKRRLVEAVDACDGL